MSTHCTRFHYSKIIPRNWYYCPSAQFQHARIVVASTTSIRANDNLYQFCSTLSQHHTYTREREITLLFRFPCMNLNCDRSSRARPPRRSASRDVPHSLIAEQNNPFSPRWTTPWTRNLVPLHSREMDEGRAECGWSLRGRTWRTTLRGRFTWAGGLRDASSARSQQRMRADEVVNPHVTTGYYYEGRIGRTFPFLFFFFFLPAPAPARSSFTTCG